MYRPLNWHRAVDRHYRSPHPIASADLRPPRERKARAGESTSTAGARAC